ncbi:MAG TPA: EAL domain-containing protein [Burkholderiaceae bacterium]|jgi:diguanylate cyclase (GGDEF)-like protein/PAS domain S-box-containing protein
MDSISNDDNQLRLRLALDAANMAVWDSSVKNGKIMDGEVIWSDKGAALLGFEKKPLTHSFKEFLECVHADDRKHVHDVLQSALEGLDDYALEYRVIWPDSSIHWLSAKAHVFGNNEGKPTRTLGIIWDITKKKQDELTNAEQKELAEVTLGSIGDAVITTDDTGKTKYLNRVAEQLTGWSLEQAKDKSIDTIFQVVDEATGELYENVALKCLRLKQTIGVTSRSQLITKDHRTIAIEDSAAPIRSKDGRVLGAVLVFHDVSHERQLNHQLSWQASHDALTSLINRREFEIHLAGALATAKSEHDTHALLYMDLDQFKVINDTCGHNAGDALLQVLTKMLQEKMRDSDILARLGGDEFGVLLLNCPVEQAHYLADNLRTAVKDFRFVWDKHTFEIGVSIGLVAINADSKSMSELLIAADQACYIAKEQGRNRVHLYQESDLALARRHGEMLWVARLSEAMERNHFRLYKQPIVSLNGSSHRHEEILIRIVNGNGELILPGAFIPAAERYDMMLQIDRWVIRKLCHHIRQQHGEMNLLRKDASTNALSTSYSINLSGISLNDNSLHQYIAEQFQEFGVSPEHISFEITETAVIANMANAQLFMEKIKKLGCRFALDDFGSGLSSFAYLKAFPVDYLKIDGLFVRDIATNAINRAMVSAINEVGHVMGIKTIAEYVENDDTLESVRNIGIDYAQGYAVGKLEPLILPSESFNA